MQGVKVHADDTLVSVLTLAAGAPKSPDCGRTGAMTGHGQTSRHRRCGTSIHRTARASTPQDISGRFMASCKPMAMRASMHCMNQRASGGDCGGGVLGACAQEVLRRS